MKRITIALAIILLASGCATTPQTVTNTYWSKADSAKNEIYQAKTYCRTVALGAVPSQDAAFMNAQSRTLNMGVGALWGTAIAVRSAKMRQQNEREQIFSECMMGLGWRLQSETTQVGECTGVSNLWANCS